MIQVRKLSKRFEGEVVLDQVDLDIQEGEIIAILGESGTGKSVLLKHLIGLLKPDQGQIYIDEQEITALPERTLLKLRRNIGYMFQEGALYDFMNVFQNIAFPLREHTNLKKNEIIRKIASTLKFVGLEGIEEKYPSELSGGMKKRVGLARAMILDSKLLFCDEPTSGLDPIRSRDISDLIKNVSRQLGSTTIITSHDIDCSFRIADRLAILKNGKIIIFGTKKELENSKNAFVQEFIS